MALQDPHFVRNIALFTAELADDLAHSGAPEEAAATGSRVLTLLTQVRSARIHAMLDGTARALRPHRSSAVVAGFLTGTRRRRPGRSGRAPGPGEVPGPGGRSACLRSGPASRLPRPVSAGRAGAGRGASQPR